VIIDPGYLLTHFDFQILAMNAFLTKYQERDELARIPDFQVSNGFVEGFKTGTTSPLKVNVSSGGRNQMMPQGSRDGRMRLRKSLHRHHWSVF
jgi:hypothetical protein